VREVPAGVADSNNRRASNNDFFAAQACFQAEKINENSRLSPIIEVNARPSSRLPRKTAGCYTFAASRGGFRSQACLGTGRPDASATTSGCRVLNSVAAGRRLARRTVLLQTVATLLAALVCLSFGAQAALGGLVGGAAMTLGSALAAWGAFSGGVVGAEAAFGRLLLGLAAKWVVVVAGLLLAIAVWKLPALPVLAGAAMAASALLFTARSGLRRD
jgi:ATP synthase protein I